MTDARRTAVVTGASSGIGAETARRLAAEGWHVVVGARRLEPLQELAREIGGDARVLDVTDTASVEGFCQDLEDVSLLVNNAGGALGLDAVADADEGQWRWMYEANVLGVVRVTRALLPRLVASRDGHLIIITSIAGHEVYEGGGGYTAAKHAARAVAGTLRLELNGQPIRVTEISPGLVETEFSLVRFGGNEDRAAGVYEGMQPLTAADIADCIAWAASRPSHVNIDQLVVKPRAQATATRVHREPA